MPPNVENFNSFHSISTKSIYNCIFGLFYISGLFNSSHTQTKNMRYIVLQILNVLFNIIIHIIQLLSCLSLILYSETKSKRNAVVYTSICIVYGLCRIYLFLNYCECKKIVKQISHISHNIGHRTTFPKGVILLSSLKIMHIIIMFVKMNMTINYVKILKVIFFSNSVANDYIIFFFAFISSVNFILFFYLPLCIFDILYAMVCHDIVCIIDRFRHILKNSVRCDYNELTHIYCNIMSVAEYFDLKVGFGIFTSLLYNAFLIYYGLTLALKNDVENDMQFFMILFSCSVNCVNFITRVEYASRIYASTVLVKYESRMLCTRNNILSSSYIKFLLNCRKVSLTIWGFIDMRRNIILGMFGTILTYSLMFDNILKF